MNPHPKNGGSHRILVVEDDVEVQALLRDEFTDEGYGVLQAFSVDKASKIIETEDFDVVIVDLGFPVGNGFELLPVIKNRNAGIPVIVFSAYGDRETQAEAFRRGADRFVVKPFRMGNLKNTVKEVVLNRREV